jgi:hypothetical protein
MFAWQLGGGGAMALLPLILIFVVFYFLLILPQQRRQKKWQKMLGELKTEEEADEERLQRVSAVMAVIVAMIGVGTTVIGMVFTFRTGGSPAAVVLAIVLLVTGLGFSAIGLRLLYKTLRQQGAL